MNYGHKRPDSLRDNGPMDGEEETSQSEWSLNSEINSNVAITEAKGMTDGALNLPPEPDLSNCTRYPGLEAFDLHYKTVHAYLSLGICFFGIFTNTLNAVILTHNHMRSPTNLLLTSIAIADSVTMVAYVAKDVYLHFITSPDPVSVPHGCGGIYFVLLTNFTAIGGHIFSTIMTVMLAAFRCWMLYRPQCQVLYKHIKQTVVVAALLGVAMFVLGISALVVGKLAPPIVPKNITQDYYWFAVREGLDYVDRANFVIYGCFSKLASSILIAFFTGLILAAIEKARRRYLKLKHRPPRTKALTSEQAMDMEGTDVGKRESRGNHRTTVMLVAVVVSFIITEAPQGVIITVVAIQDYCFLYTFYAPIGDLLDLLVLLNSSTNFILYCAMSAQFRKSFKELVMDELFHRLCRQKGAGPAEGRNAKQPAETVLVNRI